MRMSSPVFGLMSGFGTAVGLLPHIATLCLLFMTGIPPRSVLLGISSLSTDVQVLIILCGKGLFANVTIIARAAIAKVVKIKTVEKFGKV